jgi:SAM-dependent methyltransferase
MTSHRIYASFSRIYEAFEGATSAETWRLGILPELVRCECRVSRILDLGAGTGVGHRVLSVAFPQSTVISLERCAEMLEGSCIPIESRLLADMADFRYEGPPFDFVVCGFDALNYLSKTELAGCLTSVAAVLKPGGRFIFDYLSRQLLKYDWGHLDTSRSNGRSTLHTQHRYEPLLDRTRVQLYIAQDDIPIGHETHFHYCVNPFDLYELASNTGFEQAHVRNLNDSGFSPSHTTHVWTLRRG